MSRLSSSLQQVVNAAVEAQRSGRFNEAAKLFEQALKSEPNNHQWLASLGTCQTCTNRIPEGRRNIERALRIAPRDPRYMRALAYTWKREGKFREALDCFDKALQLAPGDPAYVAPKAEVYHMMGDYEKAMKTLQPALTSSPGHADIVGIFAVLARPLKRQAEAIPLVERLLGRTDLTVACRIKSSFELGSLYDSVGQYEKAFAWYQRGNKLKADRWNHAQHSNLVSQVIATWSPDTIRTLPRAKVDGSRFVFIVGMPRSGTSLVEQIIATAPSVYGAGELNELLRAAWEIQGGPGMGIPMVWALDRLQGQDRVDSYARAYVDAVAKLAGPGYTTVTDKQPVNFLNLGLIQTLLPGAKVIHCRREAMDSCLSCYFQLFVGGLPFAGDLTDCGKFYRDYERIMAYWKSVLELPILDVQYESLVADQEGMTRRILEFLGLEFSDAALKFHESLRPTLTASSQQVREPIYKRSIARWKHYESHIEQLRLALGEYAPNASAE